MLAQGLLSTADALARVGRRSRWRALLPFPRCRVEEVCVPGSFSSRVAQLLLSCLCTMAVPLALRRFVCVCSTRAARFLAHSCPQNHEAAALHPHCSARRFQLGAARPSTAGTLNRTFFRGDRFVFYFVTSELVQLGVVHLRGRQLLYVPSLVPFCCCFMFARGVY